MRAIRTVAKLENTENKFLVATVRLEAHNMPTIVGTGVDFELISL
jgi:hypothetical protein